MEIHDSIYCKEINNLLSYVENLKGQHDKLLDKLLFFDVMLAFVVISIITFSTVIFHALYNSCLIINLTTILFVYLAQSFSLFFIGASSKTLRARLFKYGKAVDSIIDFLRENSSLLSEDWSISQKKSMKIRLSLFDISTSPNP
jgi:hypothetical protein